VALPPDPASPDCPHRHLWATSGCATPNDKAQATPAIHYLKGGGQGLQRRRRTHHFSVDLGLIAGVADRLWAPAEIAGLLD